MTPLIDYVKVTRDRSGRAHLVEAFTYGVDEPICRIPCTGVELSMTATGSTDTAKLVMHPHRMHIVEGRDV